MKKARPILLLVDNRTRDSHGILLVYYWLKHLGCKVVLSNKRNWLIAFQTHRPSVVALSLSIGHGRDEFLGRLAKLSRVVLIPTEGAMPVQEDAVKWATGEKWGTGGFTSGLAKVFVWGPQTASWLLEAGVYREDQVIISGTPRLDPYFVSADLRQIEKGVTQTIGIGFAGDYGHINTYHGINMIDLVERRRNVDAGIFYDRDRNIEDYIWFLSACLRIDLDLIERWTAIDNTPIYLRPDPFELLESYDPLKLKYPNLVPSNREPLWRWLTHTYCLLTHFSSTGIEALISGIPVVSPMKIMGERLHDHITTKALITPFRNFYWQPESQDEALQLLSTAKRNELAPSPDPEGFSKYIKDFYDWPRCEPSSFTIAKELMNLAGEHAGNNSYTDAWRHSQARGLGLQWASTKGEENDQRLLRKMKYAMPKLLVDLAYSFNDIRLGDFTAMQQYHFYSWHRGDFRQARIIWEGLRTKLAMESEIPGRLE